MKISRGDEEGSRSKRGKLRCVGALWAAVASGGTGVALLGLTANGAGGYGSPAHVTMGRISIVLITVGAVLGGAVYVVNKITPVRATAAEQQLRQQIAQLRYTVDRQRAENERLEKATADRLDRQRRQMMAAFEVVIKEETDKAEARGFARALARVREVEEQERTQHLRTLRPR